MATNAIEEDEEDNDEAVCGNSNRRPAIDVVFISWVWRARTLGVDSKKSPNKNCV
jgi:hypothetical protein